VAENKQMQDGENASIEQTHQEACRWSRAYICLHFSTLLKQNSQQVIQ
jgi:hypothetical protein